jgi:hypothetical protein
LSAKKSDAYLRSRLNEGDIIIFVITVKNRYTRRAVINAVSDIRGRKQKGGGGAGCMGSFSNSRFGKRVLHLLNVQTSSKRLLIPLLHMLPPMPDRKYLIAFRDNIKALAYQSPASTAAESADSAL